VTNAELRALPVGTRIKCDEDEGEIVGTGPTVEIWWPSLDRTVYIDTGSENWQSLVSNFTKGESK
jgi:hypothetical protein